MLQQESNIACIALTAYLQLGLENNLKIFFYGNIYKTPVYFGSSVIPGLIQLNALFLYSKGKVVIRFFIDELNKYANWLKVAFSYNIMARVSSEESGAAREPEPCYPVKSLLSMNAYLFSDDR